MKHYEMTKKNPSYGYHTKTDNKSFKAMYKYLKTMGLKGNSNKFFLALYDQSLQDVDPFDRNLTQEQKARILIETQRNAWYYIRELVRINVAGGLHPYKLHIANLSLTWATLMNQNIILQLPRQNGKTMGKAIIDSWIFNFGSQNANCVYLNISATAAADNLSRLASISGNLPEWMKRELDHPSNKNNETEKYNAILKNKWTSLGSAQSKAKADEKARGMTLPLIYYDEFAFIKFNDVIVKASAPAVKTASEIAKETGVPYGKCITSTPSSLDMDSGKYMKELIDRGAEFNIKLFTMTHDEISEWLIRNSHNRFLTMTFSYKEVGRDEKWLEEMKIDLNGDEIAIKRELLNKWTYSNNNSLFSESEIVAVEKHIKEPIGELEMIYKARHKPGKVFERAGFMKLYDEIDPDINYLIGSDVAGGNDADYSTFVVLHPEDFRIVGVWKNNKIDTEELKWLMIDTARLVMPKSIWFIERNNFGTNILDALSKIPDIKRRLFYLDDRKIGKERVAINGGKLQRSQKIDKTYGFITNKVTRPEMLQMLVSLVREHPEMLAVEDLFEDIKALEKKKNDRIEHRDGLHDDVAFAYIIIRYAVYWSPVVKEVFNISPVATKTNIKDVGNLEGNKVMKMINMVNDPDSIINNITRDEYDDFQETVNYGYGQIKKQSKPQQSMFSQIANLNNPYDGEEDHDVVDFLKGEGGFFKW